MKPTIELFIGAPLEIDSEKAFFAALRSQLLDRGESAVIFANFFTPNSPHQIDFFVATTKRAAHIELKNYTGPVFGNRNGPWQIRQPNGRALKLDVKNPYRQALDCKYAISDAMRQLAAVDRGLPPSEGRKFYQLFESMVCIFPELHSGSCVETDYKVQILGWPEVFEKLVTADTTPVWGRQQWIELASHMGLAKWDVDEREPELIAAERNVRAYAERFTEFYRTTLHELVDIPVRHDGTLTSTHALTSLLTGKRHIQVIGEAGEGKTHLLSHLAMHAAEAGHIPIVLSAAGYSGSLSMLLDRSVAFLHPGRASNLLSAAQKVAKPIVLVVDALNDCPPPHLTQLIKDLQAICLRCPLTIAMSSQVAVKLPPDLSASTIEFAELSSVIRRAIVASHSATSLPQDVDDICEPFKNPFDLSLAGQCLQDLAGRPTRVQLYDAYIRRHVSQSANPAALRLILRRLAELMGDQLTTFLSLQECWSAAESVLLEQSCSATVLNDLFRTKLLRVSQGRASFRHELLAIFLEAEALQVRCRTAADVVAQLSKPRKHHLLDAVLGMSSDPTITSAILDALARPELLRDCLRGRHGKLASERTHSHVMQLLVEARAAIDATDACLSSQDEMHIEVSGGPQWSTYQLALMRAVGRTLGEDGMFLREILELVALTEAHCIRRLQHHALLKNQNQPRKGQLVAGLWVFGGQSRSAFPASTIVNACEHNLPNISSLAEREVAARLERHDFHSFGELYIFCILVRRASRVLSQYLPDLLDTCWQTGIYHLRLEALTAAQCHSHELDQTSRGRIRELLPTFETQNIFLSSALIDVLHAYELIEPPVTCDQASADIEEVLQNPDDSIAQFRASAIVSKIFEEIFSESYMSAIDRLTPSQRLELLTLAALGSENYSFENDWVLEQLVEFHDRRALPAFLRFVSAIDVKPFCVQQTVSCYVCAMIGASDFLDSPPQMKDLSSDDRRAWQFYGEIFFWHFKPDLSAAVKRDQCRRLWRRLRDDLPFAAVDPLKELARCSLNRLVRDQSAVADLIRNFRDEVIEILEFGIGQLDRLTSLFDRDLPSDRDERAHFIIQQLGSIGSNATAVLLERHVDTAKFGALVVKAVRSIRMRHQTVEAIFVVGEKR